MNIRTSAPNAWGLGALVNPPASIVYGAASLLVLPGCEPLTKKWNTPDPAEEDHLVLVDAVGR